MSQVGGDLGQLVSLKKKFEDEALDVNRLVGAISSALGQTWWVGAASDRFRDAWNTDFKRALERLNTALIDAGREVGNREQALRNAGQ